MAGTKNSGRPGGNPEITKYSFQTDREEALTAKLSMRISPSLLEELKEHENWQELVREAIAEKLASQETKS
jgi:hypothetical protein